MKAKTQHKLILNKQSIVLLNVDKRKTEVTQDSTWTCYAHACY